MQCLDAVGEQRKALHGLYNQTDDRGCSGLVVGPVERAAGDGDFEQGYFAPWSWWPFLIGGFGALVFLSLAVGWWLFFIGFPLALIALIGFVFERSRGQLAH